MSDERFQRLNTRLNFDSEQNFKTDSSNYYFAWETNRVWMRSIWYGEQYDDEEMILNNSAKNWVEAELMATLINWHHSPVSSLYERRSLYAKIMCAQFHASCESLSSAKSVSGPCRSSVTFFKVKPWLRVLMIECCQWWFHFSWFTCLNLPQHSHYPRR